MHINLSRLVNLWGFASRSLVRHWKQSVSILVPLAVAMGVVSAMTFVRDGFRRDAGLSSAFLPDITLQVMSAGRIAHVPPDVENTLSAIESVRKVVPRVWGFLPMRVGGREVAYSLLGIDPSRMPVPREINLAMKSGRFLETRDRRGLVVGESAAKALNLDAGKTINIRTPTGDNFEFRVVGVFTSAVQIYTADLLIIHIDDARQFFGYRPGEASDLCVYVRGQENVDSAAAQIAKSVSGARVLTRDKLTRISEQAYGARSGVFQLVWMILLLTVALTAWSQASSTGLQMKKEIGILKALGWSTMDIIQLRLLATAILSLLACLAGLCTGLGYLYLGAPGIKEYFLGWAAIYPEFPIPVHIRVDSLVILFAVGTVPMLAAVVVPSWLTGITEPDTAIRGV